MSVDNLGQNQVFTATETGNVYVQSMAILCSHNVNYVACTPVRIVQMNTRSSTTMKYLEVEEIVR
jgi:thermostable 8-oxoguanine DNA glycosylase